MSMHSTDNTFGNTRANLDDMPSSHERLSMDSPSFTAAASSVDDASSSQQEERTPATPTEPLGETSSNDFTLIPKIIDAHLEEHDKDGALRSTIVKAGTDWTRRRQENLLLPMVEDVLTSSEIDQEKQKAFDLLIALSRSGSLPIEKSELHIIIAVSHCFESDIMDTIISENVNPIDKVEKSLLLIGSVIHNQPASALLASGNESDPPSKVAEPPALQPENKD